MSNNESFSFEFAPDTTEQQEEIKKCYPRSESECAAICARVGVRARILKNGSYVGHIFEDGSVSMNRR